MAELKPGGPAPYTTAVSATAAMDAFRDRGLGTPVTAEVLTLAGVKETIANRTLMSLKQLGLVDENGQPSSQFEELRLTRGDEEYHARLQEWLRGVYADVLQYTDPSADPPAKVADAFRGYEPAGQRPAMAALLIGLWRYAGLPIADPGSNAERASRPSQRPTAKASPSRKPSLAGGARDRSSAGTGGGTSGGGGRAGEGVDLPPELLGLLQAVPRGGAGWTADRREAFLGALRAVLDFSVPIVRDVADQAASDDEEGEDFDP